MRNIILLVILLSALPLQAQQTFTIDRGETNLWQDFTYDMGNVFQGVGFAYSRPLYWDGGDALIAGGVAATTLGIFVIDDDINREFRSHRDEIPSILLDYGNYAGAPQNNYGLTGAIYLTGLFTRNEKLRRTGVLLISSATATGFFQQLTKSATGRARPSGGFGKNHFKPFGGESVYRSFPSGHAVLTFTNAHVIAKQFDNAWVKAGIYAVGVVPGLSRIYDNQHWASDVFLSWALSYFMVEAIDLYLDRKYEQKYNDDRTMKTSLDLNFSLTSIGVSYSF
ncbi:phosphoesterase [Nonlabens sp. YIK11]|uniref:phosphatase PAP2 family protein n=1 Tax=Nonlabens sp. YIK11 TaxID=1453349 RepID=UPI0006DCC6C2|nr:phosphatase PAP2 family protein [Nonlabens sp. YIK11]KQC33053.1 phosphoesterase [Nonlabens sp. YIK11]